MHERGIAADIVAQAERAAGVDADKIASMRLRIGPLAGVTPAGIANAVTDESIQRLGYAPSVIVDVAEDIRSPDATGVVLQTVTVGD